MRKLLTATALLALAMLAAPTSALAQPTTKYTIIWLVSGPDTRAQHQALLTTIETAIQGEACTGDGADRWCDYYTYVANPLIQAEILFVVNGDLASTVGNQLDRTSTAYKRLTFPVTLSRAEMIRRGKLLARGDGAERYLVVQAGDVLPADLLGAFLPF